MGFKLGRTRVDRLVDRGDAKFLPQGTDHPFIGIPQVGELSVAEAVRLRPDQILPGDARSEMIEVFGLGRHSLVHERGQFALHVDDLR